jgi:prepilin-type N-terminal cleavage/methylation domain-containing protein
MARSLFTDMKKTTVRNGFTLIELLIVIAIIGIIATILIPNLLDAMQKAKQKRTMQEMRDVGTAMLSWLSDNLSASAAGAAPTTFDVGDWQGTDDFNSIKAALTPTYIQTINARDAWRHSYAYRLDLTNPERDRVIFIGSGGRDGSDVSGTYPIGAFDPTDYAQDIVWADGRFLRRPERQ